MCIENLVLSSIRRLIDKNTIDFVMPDVSIYIRRFANFFPNLLKSLDPSFAKSVVGSFQFIEYKGLIEMAEPRVISHILLHFAF